MHFFTLGFIIEYSFSIVRILLNKTMPNTLQDDSKHVIIAEDDDDDYLIFSIAIKETSYKVLLTRAENGDILLKLLDQETPDILFLDILLPGKDGRECLRIIRANKKYDAVPIIIYTSLDDLKNIEYCYREGSNLYTIKPSSIDALKEILERILSINWKKTMYFPQKSQFVLRFSSDLGQ